MLRAIQGLQLPSRVNNQGAEREYLAVQLRDECRTVSVQAARAQGEAAVQDARLLPNLPHGFWLLALFVCNVHLRPPTCFPNLQ